MKTWTVVADQENAYFYSGSGVSKSLQTLFSLNNGFARKREKEYNADRPGRGTDAINLGVHSKASATSSKEHELDKFCDEIAEKINHASAENTFERLILVAGPKVLGFIRKHLNKNSIALIVDEINKDLTHLDKNTLNEKIKELAHL